MITDYAFGKMTIDDQTYTRDLIILPGGRIITDWYRQSGHLLTEKDLEAVLSQAPRLIIAGTGAYGRMDITPGLGARLKEKGITLSAMETAKAADRYNAELRNHTPGLCGCFHLTC
jgi:hypothetical protein